MLPTATELESCMSSAVEKEGDECRCAQSILRRLHCYRFCGRERVYIRAAAMLGAGLNVAYQDITVDEHAALFVCGLWQHDDLLSRSVRRDE